MATRVTVVVPVYNPGRYLDACVASLRRQSLTPECMEIILVDDGSTDGSGRRLDRLAAEAANMRVIHTSNSGWPGRPRNIGLDAAQGDYVHFLDHDDWLGDEALERLLAMADRTGADVVLGREVGHGRGVPIELFRANADDARLDSDPLVRLMTPHKLFRRSMLVEHGIRFPEGRRRFEDHVFVLRAYFAARTISILADYPCYHWMTRADGKNASDEYEDPRSYYADLRDVFDVVESNTEPGATRDRLIAHWYRRRCLDRLRGERWTDAPSAHDISAFHAVRDLARDRVGPGVDAILPLSHRLRSAAVRADRPDLVSALARLEHGLRARVRVQRLEREGRWLRLHVSADVDAIRPRRGTPSLAVGRCWRSCPSGGGELANGSCCGSITSPARVSPRGGGCADRAGRQSEGSRAWSSIFGSPRATRWMPVRGVRGRSHGVNDHRRGPAEVHHVALGDIVTRLHLLAGQRGRVRHRGERRARSWAHVAWSCHCRAARMTAEGTPPVPPNYGMRTAAMAGMSLPTRSTSTSRSASSTSRSVIAAASEPPAHRPGLHARHRLR